MVKYRVDAPSLCGVKPRRSLLDASSLGRPAWQCRGPALIPIIHHHTGRETPGVGERCVIPSRKQLTYTAIYIQHVLMQSSSFRAVFCPDPYPPLVRAGTTAVFWIPLRRPPKHPPLTSGWDLSRPPRPVLHTSAIKGLEAPRRETWPSWRNVLKEPVMCDPI